MWKHEYQHMTNSTTAPPPKKKTAIFFNTKVSWLLDTRRRMLHKIDIVKNIFLSAKDYRTTTLGGQAAPYFRRCGRGLVSQLAQFL